MRAFKGNVPFGDAVNGKSASSVRDEPLSFAVKDGKFKVSGATILETGCR